MKRIKQTEMCVNNVLRNFIPHDKTVLQSRGQLWNMNNIDEDGYSKLQKKGREKPYFVRSRPVCIYRQKLV